MEKLKLAPFAAFSVIKMDCKLGCSKLNQFLCRKKEKLQIIHEAWNKRETKCVWNHKTCFGESSKSVSRKYLHNISGLQIFCLDYHFYEVCVNFDPSSLPLLIYHHTLFSRFTQFKWESSNKHFIRHSDGDTMRTRLIPPTTRLPYHS